MEALGNEQAIIPLEETMEPFGGLVPDTVKGKVLAEIVADPTGEFTPSSLAELTDNTPTHVSKALKEYEKIGILVNVSRTSNRPTYVLKEGSKRLVALTFLALAVVDDKLGENCMDEAIVEYVRRDLGLQTFARFNAAAVAMIGEDHHGQKVMMGGTCPLQYVMSNVGGRA